jgi:cytochrome b6-f complex iron-sulfur subunit
MEEKMTEMSETEKKDKKKSSPRSEKEGNVWMIRRDFLSLAGWGAFITFLGTVVIASIRFLFPRVSFEPSPIFKAGLPDEYLVDTVNTKWVKDYRVFIVREEKGLYALSAICTHLGCTARWLEFEKKFKCPCHGSGFTSDGINFEGPAPRPLERYKIALDADGQIEVDRSIKFLYARGEWDKPGAFLKMRA